MTTNNDEQLVKELLTRFIEEMNEWENLCNKIEEDETLSYDEQIALQRLKVAEIFLKYCTPKDRKNGRPNTISYGVPPDFEYDANDEKILSVTPQTSSKITVMTARTKPMPMNFMYTVLKIEGRWLVDAKKRESKWEQKWKVESL